MSDRIHSFTVVLEKDLRADDDAKPIMDAVRQLRGVISVTANVSDITSHMAEQRATHDLGQKLLQIVFPK